MSSSPTVLSRRVLSISSSSDRPLAWKSENSTPSLARALARFWIGLSSGRNLAMRQ